MRRGMIYGMSAAFLFGSSAPFAKILLQEVSPIFLAGLFYIGSGLGLYSIIFIRNYAKKHVTSVNFSAKDIPWLIGSVISGGIMAPIFLMLGIALIPASSASLLLNSETVLTALLAWIVFKEKFDWRIMIGMIFTISANILISFQEMQIDGFPWGSVLIIASCFCWSVDNNLTRKISANDALTISAIKCSVAGFVNLSIALFLGQYFPSAPLIFQSLIVGFFGYGLSLMLFILALRHLGAAKSGAYFSVAPFCGAALSLLILHENQYPLFWAATALMLIGIAILSYKELFRS